jgi:hypothetical protein
MLHFSRWLSSLKYQNYNMVTAKDEKCSNFTFVFYVQFTDVALLRTQTNIGGVRRRDLN